MVLLLRHFDCPLVRMVISTLINFWNDGQLFDMFGVFLSKFLVHKVNKKPGMNVEVII